MNSACGRSPAAADWLPLEAEKQGCGPFRGRDFPDAGKVTKGAPSSSPGSWLRFAPKGQSSDIRLLLLFRAKRPLRTENSERTIPRVPP